MRLRSWGVSDVGKVRQRNEDYYAIDEALGLYVVCDGMGGHNGGEIASRVATDTIVRVVGEGIEALRSVASERTHRHARATGLITDAIQQASAEVWQKAQEEQGLRGMGCTAVVVLLLGNEGFVGHVGDSRLDLIRDGQLFHLTEDHTLARLQQRSQGLELAGRRKIPKNVLTRAVGIQEAVQVDTVTIDLLPGDRLILCSDGFHGFVRDAEVPPMLKENAPNPAQMLVDRANTNGGRDNITVILIQVGDDGSANREEVLSRLEAFRKMPLFYYFSFKQLMAVSSVSETITFKPGEVLFREGDAGTDLFIILRGEVSISQGGAELARLGAGGHFGEMGLVDDAPRSATVRAIGPTVCAVIRREQLMDLLRREPPLAVKLLWSFVQTLSARLRNANQDLSEAKRQLLNQAFKDLANHLGPFEAPGE